MPLEQFLFQLGFYVLWEVVGPQVPLILFIAGTMLAWRVAMWLCGLWVGGQWSQIDSMNNAIGRAKGAWPKR